jgi:predicted methyltransferase
MKFRVALLLVAGLIALEGFSSGVLAGDASMAERLHDATLGDQRSEANAARDVYRHPWDTLEFFGMQPTMTVVEIWPGGGWYTEILAPALRGTGKLVAASFGEDSSPAYRPRLHKELLQKFADRPDVYDQVEVIDFDPPAKPALGADGSSDMVLTFRNVHNWINGGFEKEVFASMFKVLKPGGVLGLVEHRAAEGADPKESSRSGYVPQNHVIELAKAAGFVLEASSEINANPLDTRDYEQGVWTLPPSLALKDKDRDRYLAIGESDRMTLRFRKPAS